MAKNITSLDFDEIKTNLIDFLKTKPEFTDYDFTGSALNTLIDVLAYNTHYNGFYVNMLYNESFLNTAVKRSSVVGHAKNLGYMPKSPIASSAILTVVLENVPQNTPAFLVNRGTIFNSTVEGVQYDFLVVEDTIVQTDGIAYVVPNLLVKEGVVVENKFTVDGIKVDRKITVPNKDIDTTTLRVFVQEDAQSLTRTEFKLVDDIYNADGFSEIYFLEESLNGEYEVSFGDNIIGKALDNGNIVTLEYFVTSKGAANGAVTFTLNGTIEGFTAVVIPNGTSFGGAEKETIESIKFNAPREYARQNRVITSADYEAFLKSKVPNLESVVVWGGEDAVPPQFGKVFISLKPVDGFFYSNAEKESILSALVKKQNVITVKPIFVDPLYIDVCIDIDIRFSKERSSLEAKTVASIVNNVVIDFFNDNVSSFGKDFAYSKLVAAIDKVDSGILSNYSEVLLSGRLTNLTLNTPNGYEIEFLNKTRLGTVRSTIFNTFITGREKTVFIQENPEDFTTTSSGKILYTLNIVDTNTQEIIAKVGTVDHTTGSIRLVVNPSFIDTGAIPYNDIMIYVEPINYDLQRKLNYIIRLNSDVELGENRRVSGIKVNIESV